MNNVLRLLRPTSWIKNFFIFVPLFFAREFLFIQKLESVIVAFICFSLTASCVYILNDIADREQDKLHDKKKFRPIASGAVSVRRALQVFAVLLITTIALTHYVVPAITYYLAAYFLLNIAYSFYLKHIATIDILLISGFFLIRILIGGEAAGVHISLWLLLCTIFISLFLIVGKRIAEFNGKSKRAVLNVYTSEFLTALLIIAATLSIISYSLYSVLVLNSYIAVYSIFFVLLGVLRYVFIVFTSAKSEYPERAVVSDPIVLVATLGWIIFMCMIFY
ncbi:MAG: hypothetical protein RL094_248 [Candidatus Parcubacteria bacterium]|jgi:4-hydroxybenzoate polyprenyltransferase